MGESVNHPRANSEAELEAILARGEDSSAYEGLSPRTPVPSDLMELTPRASGA